LPQEKKLSTQKQRMRICWRCGRWQNNYDSL